ncbi:hypothetical protein F2Q69_00045109, partial [Brassica cretica]
NLQPQTISSAIPSPVEYQPPTSAIHQSDLRNRHERPLPALSLAELADRSALSKPESFSDAVVRIRKNYSYFKVNDGAVATAIVGFSLVTHPFSLIFLLCILASWLLLYLFRPSDQPIVVLGNSFLAP